MAKPSESANTNDFWGELSPQSIVDLAKSLEAGELKGRQGLQAEEPSF